MSQVSALFTGFSLAAALALSGCAENSTLASDTNSHLSPRVSGLLLEVVSSSPPSYDRSFYFGEGSEKATCQLYPIFAKNKDSYFQIKVDQMSADNLGNQFVTVDCWGRQPWVVKHCNANTRVVVLVGPPSEFPDTKLTATLIGGGSGYNFGEYQRYQVFEVGPGVNSGFVLGDPPRTVELTLACLPK